MWPARLVAALLLLLPVTLAQAHEVRPAYLQITERPDGKLDVLWKQPSSGAMAVRLVPHISGGLLESPPSRVDTAQNFQIRRWTGLPLKGPLDGHEVTIEGLDQLLTDVLVSVTSKKGNQSQDILKPDQPRLTIAVEKAGLPVLAYLRLGIEHILTGVDHLMFVLGLVLLVRNTKTLIQTITAFTIAHSITLAATALGVVHVIPAVIECLVALSIVFVALELVHSYRGKDGLTIRYPWLIAFSFGLLHGSAFAGALAEIGLPQNAIPLSLALFNLGVEAGQLLFVAVVLLAWFVLRRLPERALTALRWVPPYAIGGFAAFWFIERLHIVASA